MKYGFQPLETPAMENLSTLTGKYGDEGDKLLFRVLDQGDFTAKVDQADWDSKNAKALAPQLSSKGMRYDLTVPLARAIVQHQNDISFPFRRYQMQPVWRGDRPQKGRYREFWQCDADSVGSDSLTNEVDLICIYHEAFKALGFEQYDLRINHRKMLEAIAYKIDAGDKFKELTIAIDKLDKIGFDGVAKELEKRGFSQAQIDELEVFLQRRSFSSESLDELAGLLGETELAQTAISELRFIINALNQMNWPGTISLDGTLARGLDYYTGCIFEALIPESGIGSVSGGGRYDNLTGLFGLKDVSGVGISFGIDRLYDIMLDRGLFDDVDASTTKLIFCHFDEAGRAYCLNQANLLRNSGLNIEVYPDIKKLKKQLDYANQRKIQFVMVIGSNEMESGEAELKDMFTGQKETIRLSDLAQRLG